MNPLKILLVEDETVPQDTFENDVRFFKNQPNNLDVDFEIVEDVYDAVEMINVSFDGAIIDLKLGGNDQGGNEIIQILYNEFTKIPIVFVTSYPDLVVDHPSVIKIRSRDVGSYRDDLLLFQQIREIGLTHIIGGGGLIEQQLRKVYLENLLPQIETWIRYGETYKETDPKRTEKSLLRYTLNHLFQRLEEDNELFLPEEFYLYPPLPDKITTGSMVKENNQWFVVLSPACDLVFRNRQFKTERILFVEIEKQADIVNRLLNRSQKITDDEKEKKVKENILQFFETEEETDIVNRVLNHLKRITDDEKRKEMREDILQRLSRNNYTFHYHWLPPVNFKISDNESLDFDGGFLNFRKLEALSMRKFRAKFKDPLIQISPFFVKDIVSRFSSYYARQGQPEIDKQDFIDRYTS